jgi:L-amino acid N-acyltransferase YncA
MLDRIMRIDLPARIDPLSLAPESERPDQRVVVRDAAGEVAACAALWWCETPELNSRKVGAIGGFAALDGKSAALALDESLASLRAAGAATAVGPMNGNTWRRYRWVVESDGRGPFLMEPENPAAYPEWWQARGFEVMAGYSSSVVDPLAAPAVAARARRRLESSGFEIRTLDPDRYDDELRAMHALSLRGFANNFLYTPLDADSFVAGYQRLRPMVEPQCVWLVERAGELCAFLFAVADHAAAARGEAPALIAKTVVTAPDCLGHGIGGVLLDELAATARQRGVREVIHALQHETNLSLKITRRHGGRVFRKYQLFSLPLRGPDAGRSEP